jgi:LemA protein
MDGIWSPTLMVWGVAAVLLFWSVGAYNRLVRLRAKVLSIFASMVTQFERYAVWMAQHAPRVTADAPPAPAGDVWTNLRAASAQFNASLAAARSNPMDTASMAALAAARTVIVMAWQHVSDEALRAAAGVDNVATLRTEWEAINRQTESADKAFAVAVDSYNRAVRQFPAVLLAWLFGFRPARRL